MTLDLDRLEAIARAADVGLGGWSASHLVLERDFSERDAAHLAAFDPATVLRLIALARRAPPTEED